MFAALLAVGVLAASWGWLYSGMFGALLAVALLALAAGVWKVRCCTACVACIAWVNITIGLCVVYSCCLLLQVLLVLQLLHHLQDVVARRDEAGNPIETRLQQMSQELHSVISTHLQVSREHRIRKHGILDQLTHLRAQGIYQSGGVPDYAMEQS